MPRSSWPHADWELSLPREGPQAAMADEMSVEGKRAPQANRGTENK